MGAEQEWGAAGAYGSATSSAEPHRPVEQGIDLLDTHLDCDELGAALDDKPCIEAVAFVHLEREPAEIAETFLSHEE